MKIVKKINNNVAIGIDGNGCEVVIFGRGIGFEKIPYELDDLSKVSRTYYNIDSRYYGVLTEIPEEIFAAVAELLDVVKVKIKENLNPNLVFVLADHIHFAIERSRKGMNIMLPYSYEMEYSYPELTQIAEWFLKGISRQLHVVLNKGEVTSITMHFLNALEGEKDVEQESDRTSKIVQKVTGIVEDYFDFQVDRSSFHYFRFKNHIKFFVQRKEQKVEFSDNNEALFQSMKELHPQLYQCVLRVDAYMEQEFGETCPHEELLYLMIHINQLHKKEDA